MPDFLLVSLGAIFAFVFAFVLYVYQRKMQEGQYLSFTISYIVSQVSQLYCLKKDHLVPRYDEVIILEEQFEQPNPHLSLKEIANIISNSKHSSSDISLDKLGFLADFNPNLLVLVKAALNADAGVNEILENSNLQIKEVKKYIEEDNANQISEIWLLMCLNKLLYEQVDYALSLLEHSQEQLINFSKNEFKYFTIIKSCEIDYKYKPLKPEIDNSLLDIVYTPLKITFLNKIKKILNRFKTCL